jgi:hypothetical protein
MLTNLAALGIGLITAVAAPAAAAQVPCDPAVYPGANYPAVNAPPVYPASYPTYGVPVPAYPAPVPAYPPPVPVYTPVPVYMPAPPPPPRGERTPVSVRRADWNRDGGITFAEAYAYGRNEFARSDLDGNGVLTRRELNQRYDEIANGARRHDSVVRFDEYERSLRHQFRQLDDNRDGFLSGHELGTTRSQPRVVTFNWHWEL